MTDDKFLQAVARYYANSDCTMWPRLYLVFPNKRAAIYFRGYFRRYSRKLTLMPQMLTIGAFNVLFAEEDDFEVDSIELLFMLYRCYCNVVRRHGNEPMEFGRFAFWGEMILSDFDDIDAQLADAAALFENLSRLNEIGTYYLSPEQLEVISSIWGDKVMAAYADGGRDAFWKHISHESDEDGVSSSLTGRFLKLWELLPELYEEFRARLSEAHMAYPGMAARIVSERIGQAGIDDLPFDRVAFIGFSNVNNALARTMKRFRKLGVADFFWDRLPDRPYNRVAGRVVERLARSFPMPGGYNPPSEREPEVTISAVPSNFLQAKVAGNLLSGWIASGVATGSTPDNTVVMLPAQEMLVPMLHSLGDGVGTVNITMGLSYRNTPFAALLRSIVSLHMRSRMIKGELYFFHDDVREVVTIPVMRSLVPDACLTVERFLDASHQYNISAEVLGNIEGIGELASVFATVNDTNSPADVREYIFNMLDALAGAIARDAGSNLNPEAHEVKVLDAYREAASRVFGYVERYGVGEIGRGTLFGLLERIMAVQTLNMSGTPVKGIQIMGTLETRTLDFDNVIVLSMNERVFPRKTRLRSLIPQSLRRGYGLPGADDAENEYAYYFFRLLSRSRRVACFYDSRVSGLGNGAMSRYLIQLKYLNDGATPQEKAVSLTPVSAPERVISIAKDESVMHALSRFTRVEGGRNLSATALKTYRSCRLKFYLDYVCGIKSDDDPTAYMDAATYGTVLHAVLEDLFCEQRRQGERTAVIDEAAVVRMIGKPGELQRRVLYKINKEYHKDAHPERLDFLPAESRLLGEMMTDYIMRVLEKERDSVKYPNPLSFTFVDAEETLATTGREANCGQWQVTPDLGVNFRMQIDRHDLLEGDVHRFVDYKTGSDSPKATSVEALFDVDNSKCNDAIFQLLVYANAYADITGFRGIVRPALYRLREAFGFSAGSRPFDDDKVTIEKETVVWTNRPGDTPPAWQNEFRTRLEQMVSSIFDSSQPFAQTTCADNCTFCHYKVMCGRISRDNND